MIFFVALLILIVLNVGLMVYQTIMDDKLKKMDKDIQELMSQMQTFRGENK